MLRKLSYSILFILAAATVFFATGLDEVRFDYDFEKFLPADDPETKFFEAYRDTFGSDNDFILVGLKNEDGIFDADFLGDVAALTDSLQKIHRITFVNSPTNVRQLIFDPLLGTPIQKPYLRYNRPQHYTADSIKIYQQPELTGTVFSPKGKAVSLFIKTENYISKAAADAISKDFDRIFAQFDFDEVHIAGRATGQAYYVDLLQKEFILFISLAILLIIVILILSFRSFWGVWVPLLVVLLAVLWTVGILARTDLPLGIMLNVLPIIIFVVGISDVVHLITRYFEELRLGNEKFSALKTAYKEVGLATLLTSITTGVGFLTLLTSNIEPIREFGGYTAIGIVLALFLAFTLLPAVLVVSPVPKAVNHTSNRRFWNNRLHRLFILVMHHPKRIIAASSLVLAVSLGGMMLVESNNFILEDLRENDPLKKQFRFLEEHFGGVRPFEMHLTVNEGKSVWDPEVLNELDELSQYLDSAYGVSAQISPLQLVKILNQAQHGGNINHYRLPENPQQLKRLLKRIESVAKTGKLPVVATEDGQYARISGRLPDIGNIAVSEKDEKLEQFFRNEINGDLLDYKLTGTSVLIDLNNQALAENMIYGLLIAFGVVALIMGFLFRSLKMVIITLIPNLFPLIMIAGIMGFAGIPLKVSTSIIFTIAFGIAVDDTIHFMSKFKLQIMKGQPLLYAIKRTYLLTGKAIIVTSIILCGGFILLIGSEFLGTYYIGILISCTLLFAVLADLLLLPALLMLFYSSGRKRRIIHQKKDPITKRA